MTHNRASLGKRPRAEFAEEPTPETHRPHVGYTPSSDAARHAEDTHNSPSRHTPGITPGFKLQRKTSFDELNIESAERDRLIREDTELLLGLSPETKLLVELDPRAVAQVPEAVRQTPNRLRSLDAYEDVTLSPGELGGSQYIMSPGHELASSLQRSESTMSDGRTTVPSVEEVAAAAETHQNTTQNSRLFPIFVKGRKVVHLVRHGQSTYNEAISGPGSWDEPNIFDAPLTKLGVSQAKALGSFLSKLPKDAVWVTSPLTRAMETCVYGYKSSLEVTSAQRRKGAAMRDRKSVV